MKTNQIANFRLLGSKTICIAALLAGIWICSMSNSFGQESNPQGDISIVTSNPSCDDEYNTIDVSGSDTIDPGATPTVTVVNSQHTDDPMSASVSGSINGAGDWAGTWGSVTVTLGEGVNVITASDNYSSSDSTSVNVDADGYIWAYLRDSGPDYYNGGEGLEMFISVGCFSPHGDNSTYSCYETPGSVTYCGHTTPLTAKPGPTLTVNNDGSVSWSDGICAMPPASPPVDCSYSFTKTWHIYNNVSLSDVATCDDSVTIVYSSATPYLTVSDSQVSPNQTFP